MGRVQPKRIKRQSNPFQSNFCQGNDEISNQLSKELCIKSKPPDKSSVRRGSIKCQSMHHLKNAIVVLEDLGNISSFVTKRTVLGDKTNKSSMSPKNRKQKMLPDPNKQKRTPLLESGRVSDESSFSLTVNRKRLSDKNSPQRIVSSGGNSENQIKSSNFTDKCIYGKVQRETMRNRNMPFEEKLAQYEFEVDENEPIMKKKKVKRKKKVKSEEEYCPSSKIFNKILQAGVEEMIKEKSKDDVKSHIGLSEEGSRNDQALKCKVQVEASSQIVTPVRKRTRSIFENESPAARPRSRSEMRSARSSEKFAELDVGAHENNSISNASFLEKSHPNLEQDFSVTSCSSRKAQTTDNKYKNESGQFRSPVKLQSFSLGKIVLSPNQNYVKKSPFTEITSTSTPIFRSTPLNVNSKMMTNVSHSAVENFENRSFYLNKKAYIPRESGGVNNQCNKVLTENWSVENCFGFDDESEEAPEFPSFADISLKSRLRNTSAFSSTSSPNKKKPDHLSPYFKRKRGSTSAVSTNKSYTHGSTNKNTPDYTIVDTSYAEVITPNKKNSEEKLDTSVIEKSSSPVTTGLSPYSNPLKQSKFDFIAINSKTPICESPKQTNHESPLLFKESEDKTPIHFKQPARRSYVRSVRRKMRPVGSEWIEIDSESEEEEKFAHKCAEIKKKRVKLNKQKEKEASKWMKDFNRQCEEIEEFELCVEN